MPKLTLFQMIKLRILVNKEVIPKIIGRGGSTISEIEKILGIKIDVEAKILAIGEEIEFSVTESGAHIYLIVDEDLIGQKNKFIFK